MAESKDTNLRVFGQGGRDWSVDVLRVLSCWMVVFVHSLNRLHTKSLGAPGLIAGTPDWYVAVFLKASFVSATTLFVMVSGIFFLSPHRNVTVRKIWTKNVPKMACAYVFWCVAYSVFNIVFFNGTDALTLKSVVMGSFEQPNHLWYIPMIITLYVVTPFLREITAHAKDDLYRYGIILVTVALFLFTLPRIHELPYYDYVKIFVSRTPAEELCSYAVFFVFGYYLYSHRPKFKTRLIIYALGILSIIASASFAIFENSMTNDTLFAKQTITTFGKNTAIFLFVISAFDRIKFSERGKKILLKLSSTTFIIYLIHYMLIPVVQRWGIYKLPLDPVLICFLVSLIVFALGFVIAFVFQLVPWRKIKNALLSVVRRSDKRAST